jgi:hypothetical protein
MEVGPDIGASLAAGFADEAGLDIGKPDVIGPLICAGRDRVAAMMVGAIDQDAADASVAHLIEGDRGEQQRSRSPLSPMLRLMLRRFAGIARQSFEMLENWAQQAQHVLRV